MDAPTVGTSFANGSGVTGQHQVGLEAREGSPATRRANEADGRIFVARAGPPLRQLTDGDVEAAVGPCCVSLREARLASPAR
jgi:hypothetical protein